VEAVCAELKEAQTRRVKAVRQIRFARERIRHLPQAQVRSSGKGMTLEP
jgi:hypothetical protein